MNRPHRRLLSMSAGVLSTGALALALSAPAAMAHAYLESSSPGAGSREGSAPAAVVMGFDEPLNRQLSTAAIYETRTDKRVSATVSIPASLEMVLRPIDKLARGSYRVEWHSVSATDGHEVEGSFSFGVQAVAAGGVTARESGPFAGLGWLRALIRTGLYAALFVFAGALMLRSLLGGAGRGLWFLPPAARSALGDPEASALERRERSLVIDAGVLAVALGAASALLETQIAAGSLSGSSIHAFLLSNTTGLARIGLVTTLMLALAVAVLAPRAGALFAALALGALALSGHADSASPRGLAVVMDWLHLLGGTIWLGGIAVLALLWLPALRAGGHELRRAVMGQLLPRFGLVALPAFVLVALTGAVNAYIQVRHPSLLWGTPYGRTLLVKSAFVAVIALMSYTHVFRLRPRLLASNPHPNARIERRHWRFIGAEPLVGIGLAATVALLVSFPAPEQVAAARALAAQPLIACNPCVLPLPTANQLAVAGYAGPDVVAAWLQRRKGHLEGQVRLLGIDGQPASTPFEIEGAAAVSPSCGLGCRTFAIPYTLAKLNVILNPDRQEQRVTLPAQWQPLANADARRMLDRAQTTMRALRSVSQTELVSSVPGVSALTRYTLRAPDRLAWSTSALRTGQPPQFEEASVEIGDRQWSRISIASGWERQSSQGTLPFSMPTWFIWTTNAEMTRLLEIKDGRHGQIATIALMDPGVPAWQTLQIDLATSRVLSAQLITSGHDETDHFSEFNSAPPIPTPRSPGA